MSMLMAGPPEPQPGGGQPELRQAVPLTSIQQFESPDDAAEAQLMADQRSTDQHPADHGPSAERPSEDRPSEDDPSEDRPADERPSEERPGEPPQPVEPQRVEPQPVEPQPVEPQSVDPQPVEPQPEQPEPEQPQAEQPEPVQPQPEEPQAEQPQPVQPQPEKRQSAPSTQRPDEQRQSDQHQSDQRQSDQRQSDQVMTEVRPPEPPRPAPARMRPLAPDTPGPAIADIQTTSGVPATPIPAAETTEAPTGDGDGDTISMPAGDGDMTATPAGDGDTMVMPVYVAPPAPLVTPVVPGGPRAGRLPKPIKAAPDSGPERRRRPRGGPYDLGHAPAVLLLSSLGVLLVAGAYAGGRVGANGALVAYWIGQVVVFTPVVTRLLSRRMAGVAESFMLVIGLAVNQYLLKWMYSPDQFRFPDELQHWLATTIVVQSGRLFQPNLALPPAVHFPGLAEMGAATASMTGLPVTASGIIVAGVAHLVFVGLLFAAVLRASNSPAVAGVACATYATALHYLFFNSMFLYQTAALPFFMLTVWATRRWREGGGRQFALLAVVSVAVTTVSHHVTAFALVATMLLLGVTELAQERPRRWSALIMPGVALVTVLGWILLVAPDVIGYLEEPVQQIGRSFSLLVTGSSESTVTPAIAVGQLALQGIGLLGLLVLYLAVGRDMVLRHDRDTWRWAALIGGAIFFAGNGVRFLGANGPEAAGRLATFTYVPISIIAAIALVRAVQIIPSRDVEGRRWWVQPALEVPPPRGGRLAIRVAAGSVLVTVLMIGARAGGYPAISALLPGPYLVGGFERSVDAFGVDAANWERVALGPGQRVGGDLTAVSLASTYGRQNPVREVGPLFYDSDWGLADDDLAASLGLRYLVVDRRLSAQIPTAGGAYFQNDPMAGRITRPLSAAQIGKFDSLIDFDRLYDNGTVRVYRIGDQ
jgi:hypothetical protein